MKLKELLTESIDYDVLQTFQKFESSISAFIEKQQRVIQDQISKKVLHKTVQIRASKGGVGQTEQDYKIEVSGVEIQKMKEQYYIVLKTDKKKEYFLNKGYKIRILDGGMPSNDDPTKDIKVPNANGPIKPGEKPSLKGNIVNP